VRGDADRVRQFGEPARYAPFRLNDMFLHWTAGALAFAGCGDEAMGVLHVAVARGFVNWPYLAHHARLFDSLRGRADFAALLDDVERRWRMLSSAFPPR